MIIKDLAKCRYFQAADNTCICELLHPGREGLDLPYSIAHAILPPGAASLPHRLKTSTEVYFILVGEGEMHIDSEKARVRAGQAILIPPGSWQHIRNTGGVTTPMNEFTGIYGLSPMGCDPNPISLRCFVCCLSLFNCWQQTRHQILCAHEVK